MKKEKAKSYAGFGLGVIFVILVLTVGISLLNIYRAKAEFKHVTETTTLLAQTLYICTEITDIKKVEQGYIVLNEALTLEASIKSQKHIRSHIRLLRQLCVTNKIIDIEIIDQLDRLIIERFAELNTLVTAATDKGYVDAEN
jgi:CHASE3 domain sensor protein